jgi:hypothetical protein
MTNEDRHFLKRFIVIITVLVISAVLAAISAREDDMTFAIKYFSISGLVIASVVLYKNFLQRVLHGFQIFPVKYFAEQLKLLINIYPKRKALRDWERSQA